MSVNQQTDSRSEPDQVNQAAAHILMIVPQLPFPPQQGTSLRNYHILKGLAERFQVSLLSVVEAGKTADSQAIAHLKTLCSHIELVPVSERSTATRLKQMATTRLPDMAHRLYNEALCQALKKRLQEENFAVVQIEGIELARLMQIVRQQSPHAKIIFDDHNAEAALQMRNLLTDLRQPQRWVAAAYSAIQAARLSRFERWACQTANHTLAVSETDRQTLKKLVGNQKQGDWITAVPNSIDVTQYKPNPHSPRMRFDIVFSGKMDYRPNVDAVLWFARAVWPQIIAERPQTTWAIVGQKPHARLDDLRHLSGVTMTGWVESVQPYLHGATLLIMPFRIGSGTRLKLIEGMAAGKPILSTSMGSEGFPVEDGREIVLRDDAEGMKTAVLDLLADAAKREHISQAATEFAKKYDWRAIAPKLWSAVEAVLQGDS